MEFKGIYFFHFSSTLRSLMTLAEAGVQYNLKLFRYPSTHMMFHLPNHNILELVSISYIYHRNI